MLVNRRKFVTLAAAGAVTATAIAPNAKGPSTKLKAVAFDGFPIIDRVLFSPELKKFSRARGRS